MKHKIIVPILIVVSFFATKAFSQSKASEIDRLLSTYHKLRKMNGSILVAEKGKVIFTKGYGYKDISRKTFNDVNTIYQIASVTKPFTSTLVLKLAELKKLSLDDKVSRFYPNFPKGDSITITQLLSHTSGVSDHQPDTSQKVDKPTPMETFMESMKNRPLDFNPGSQWRYSNSGYILLGYIIEKVTGMTYYQAMTKYIFKPLKMNQSAFDFIKLQDTNKATGYWSFPENERAETAKLIDYTGPQAAGAIYSTVGDLYKFHRGLQDGKIIRPELLQQAYREVKDNYGYGWLLENVEGKSMVHHSGDIWGFKSEFARIPQDDICIASLSNAEDLDLHMISLKIAAILYNKPFQWPAENKIQLPAEQLKEYAGEYELRPGEFIKVETDGKRLRSTTSSTQEMYAQKKDEFLLDNGRNQMPVTFERDQTGKVIALSFKNGDTNMTCKRKTE